MWPTFPILSGEREPEIVCVTEVPSIGTVPTTPATAHLVTPCAGWLAGDMMILGISMTGIGSNEHFFPNSDRWVYLLGDHGDAGAESVGQGPDNLIIYTFLQSSDISGVPLYNAFGSTLTIDHYYKVIVRNVDKKHPFSSIQFASQNVSETGFTATTGFIVPASADAKIDSETGADGFTDLDLIKTYPIEDASRRSKHLSLARITSSLAGFSGLTASQFVDALYSHSSLPWDISGEIDEVYGSDTYKSGGNTWFVTFGRNRRSATPVTTGNIASDGWTVSDYLTEVPLSDPYRKYYQQNTTPSPEQRLLRPITKTVSLVSGTPYTFILETGDSDTGTYTGQYVWMAVQRPSDGSLQSDGAMALWGIGAYSATTAPWNYSIRNNADGLIKWMGRSTVAGAVGGAAKYYEIYFVPLESGEHTLAFGAGNGFPSSDGIIADGTSDPIGTRPELVVSKAGLVRDFAGGTYVSQDFYNGAYDGGPSNYFKVKPIATYDTHPSSEVADANRTLRLVECVLKSRAGVLPRHKFSRTYNSRASQQYYAWDERKIQVTGHTALYIYPTTSASDGILYPSTFGAPGKYYMEVEITADATIDSKGGYLAMIPMMADNLDGLTASTAEKHGIAWGVNSTAEIFWRESADGGSTLAGGVGLGVNAAVGDIIGIAHDCDTGVTTWYHNGSLIHTSTLNDEWTYRCAQFAWAKYDDWDFLYTINFTGPFAYSPPTGYVAFDDTHQEG